jgi:hypothetical protein
VSQFSFFVSIVMGTNVVEFNMRHSQYKPSVEILARLSAPGFVGVFDL